MAKLKLIISLVIIILLNSQVFAAMGSGEKHVKMSGKVFKTSEKTLLAITLVNDKKWHTYWKNPGDAGLPITFTFTLDANEYEPKKRYPWPTPHKYIEEGDILAYGYGGSNTFFFDLGDDLSAGGKLKVHGKWLVCKDICLPGEDFITVDVSTNGIGETKGYQLSEDELNEKLNELPKIAEKPESLEIYFTRGEGSRLYLQYIFKNPDLSKIDYESNIIYPYLQDPLDYKHEKAYYDNNTKSIYGIIPIDWDGEYEEPEWNLPSDGKFKRELNATFLFSPYKDERSIKFTISVEDFSPTGYETFKAFVAKLKPLSAKLGTNNPEVSDSHSIISILFFAFLGGLILNLMPCVLPVISLKLFGLVAHRDESNAKILKHNLFYTFGVVATFIALGVVILVLKISGEQVGWGFQLQSPGFVFFMLMMIFIMALNMLGLFEFITPGGKSLGTKELKKGVGADFMNGVLATILSTPCSAPFLGTALTFAFTTSNLNIFLIFIFVGIGLAFPFILTGFFPQMISFLPKPGAWMDKLKKLLGLTLILTSIWLYDVLANLIDFSFSGMYINTILALTFFAFYFRKHVSKVFAWNVLFFILPVLVFGMLLSAKGLAVNYGEEQSVTKMENSNLIWENWSEEKMKSMQGEYVFIDFTAKWCLTCKVNKKLVLNTSGFESLVKEKNLKLMIADWTKRDDNITQFLRKYDIVGVPAYFIQKPDGEIVSLGEVISIEKIRKHIE